MKKRKTVYRGFGNIFTAVLAVFIVLKLTRIIDWPWVWVLSPFWASIIIAVVMMPVEFILIWRSRNK